MKSNRSNLFIVLSSMALIAVLGIQVKWIFQTAQIKEDLFNEKANMVLSRTTEALCADNVTCRNIGACVGEGCSPEMAARLGKAEKYKIDSLFRHYMKFYNFYINYSYEVQKPVTKKINNNSGFNNFSYCRVLEKAGAENYELKLIFPEKKQFIIAEMSPLFITSVILILIVLFLFWKTTSALLKEKNISEHTTDFLNNMTHEFKTPLTNIGLAGKMMVKDAALREPEKIKYYSGIIIDENEKLRLQVEQVLSMSALERGEIPLKKTRLDFHQLINDTIASTRLQIENKGGYIQTQLDAPKYLITGDRTHLINTLCNLIDNAIKYTKGTPELNIQTSNADGHLMIRISDKGIGVEKKYHKKIFDKFFRIPTGNVHDTKGFGLGLAYVKKIIEMHQGTITLQSEKEKGTTFIITIPYV